MESNIKRFAIKRAANGWVIEAVDKSGENSIIGKDYVARCNDDLIEILAGLLDVDAEIVRPASSGATP